MSQRASWLDFADTMIAPHAFSLGLILVNNDQAFRRIEPLNVEDWTREPLPS